ncbi:hypothetical protein UlMin_009890 [Ulmus minor]
MGVLVLGKILGRERKIETGRGGREKKEGLLGLQFPNVGGFGQGDAEIVLQDPLRVQSLLLFLASVILAQIFLVLKKKQFEKVQLSEMNF